MALTVAELLGHPRLGIDILVPVALEREVRWVHATEQADPTPYLRGGEILLTDGLWLDSAATADAYVRRICPIGVAAIGYGPMPGGPGVPDSLIDACRRYQVCLFAMPPTLPFMAVSEVFVDRVAEDREAAMAMRVVRNARFLDTARSGGGPASLLRLLQDETGLPVWIAGRHGQLLHHGHFRPGSVDGAAMISALASTDGRITTEAGRWKIEPIVAIDRPHGFLAVLNDPPITAEVAAIIEQALPFLGMELAHKWALRQGQRQSAAELVELVMAGEAQLPHVAARLAAADIDYGQSLAIAVCEGGNLDALLDCAESVLSQAGLRCLAARRDEQVVVIVVWDRTDEELSDLAAMLHEQIGEHSQVGVGSLARSARSLRTSLIEARHACRMATARHNSVGHGNYRDIGSYQLLLDLQDRDVLHTFAAALLQPIIDHDRRNHADLFPTLCRFLDLDCQWQETADALHVHVNTLRQRLSRIEALIGRSMRATDTRVDLFLAVRAASSS